MSHFCSKAEKLGIRGERGLDDFVDAALGADASIALVKLAARSSRNTFQ